MSKKLDRVPVEITVTLEFDRPEFPMLATRMAVEKEMSLERYYTQAIQAMVGMQATEGESGARYQELVEQLKSFTSRP
jgi:hypothetical protein